MSLICLLTVGVSDSLPVHMNSKNFNVSTITVFGPNIKILTVGMLIGE